MRIALKLSYDGTHFSGWQIQPNGRTVQGELERCGERIFGVPVKITGSGRTDAGVHALAQVAQFDVETNIPAYKIRECFNCLLPPDVRVLESAPAPDCFDCTRGAKRKTYRYRAYFAPCELPLLDRYAVRLKERVDLEKMRRAASLIEGEHDFKAFCASGSSAKTSVRTVYGVTVDCYREQGATVYEVTVCGNGFLYNMVRIIAGELFAIGSGARDERSLRLALDGGERSLLARTMPAKGLTMVGAEYENSPFTE